MHKKRKFIVAGSVLALCFLAGVALYLRHPTDNPLDSRSGSIPGWLTICGRWTEHGNVVSNPNYGRGDLLLARDSQGKDYSISADMRFDLLFSDTGFGDAGLIIRARDPEPGVDSYRGYYAGIRPNSQTLVLGRASYSWRTLSEVRLAAPVSTGDWYHLQLSAKGCDLHVVATPADDRSPTTIDYQDAQCLTDGMAGLRSFYTQASWRNVRITPGSR